MRWRCTAPDWIKVDENIFWFMLDMVKAALTYLVLFQSSFSSALSAFLERISGF